MDMDSVLKEKVSVPALIAMAEAGEKITMVTAYDYPTALFAEQAGVEMILVGDSLGPVGLGYDSTVTVTMEDIIHHTRAVVRGAKKALIVADMPFGSYQCGPEAAVANAIRLVKEGGAGAVKLEGGAELRPLVRAIATAGIPVIAHLGLLPQTAGLWGGYQVCGRDEDSARELADTAVDLEEAGAFAILLECVAREAASLVTEKLDIPTIGIGSGPDCDGQVLVGHDLLGLNPGPPAVYVKKFAELGAQTLAAFGSYVREVKSGAYPSDAHSVGMEEGEARKLY